MGLRRAGRTAVVVVVAIALTSAACGGRGDGGTGTPTAPRAAPTPAGVADAADVGPTGEIASAGAAPASGSPGPPPVPMVASTPPAPVEAVPHPIEAADVATGALPVVATARPGCVSPGGVVEVAISTAAGATLGLAASYADHDSHGAMGFGEAASDGSYVWSIVVPANVPAGEAMAVVGAELATDGAARRVGHGLAPFTVASAGGCP